MATAILPTPTTDVLTGRRLDDIPVPPEVTAFLANVPVSPEDDRREWERQYTLSFLYGGMEVACHETPDGDIELLHAADVDDFVPWLDSLTDEQHARISFVRHPRRWGAILWDSVVRKPRRRWFWSF